MRKAPKEKVACRVKYNTAKLENEQVLRAFYITLRDRYQAQENQEPEVEEEEDVERDFWVRQRQQKQYWKGLKRRNGIASHISALTGL